MKSLKLLFILPLLACAFTTKSQQIQETLEELQTDVSFQKLYLHTDRDFYFLNDTLWFSAYLVDAQTHKLAQGWGNLHVDLINEAGNTVQNHTFPLVNGSCPGGVPLVENTIQDGRYYVRAYTDYLKNFGSDAFFKKVIQVSSIKNSDELEQTSAITSIDDIDVSFLPEGGFILANKSNCVAFKAIDQHGRAVNITGQLFDEEGAKVLSFKSAYKGAGKFYFYPNRGKKYIARIDGLPDRSFPLGEIRENGAKLKLNNVSEEEVRLSIQVQDNKPKLPYYLICMNRGEGFFLEVDQKRLNALIKMDVRQLRAGINRLVLLDNQLKPLSERLVFIRDQDVIHYELNLNAKSFNLRDQVEINVQAPEVFKDEISKVSISVIDEKYLKETGVPQNIRSYLLLDAELKGHIESPADYFVDEEDLSSDAKLDLLMTVNGWRNYIWNHLDTYPLEYQPQFGFAFKGAVKRTFGKKALPKGTVSLIIYKSDSTTAFLDQELDVEGKFEFQNVVIYDSVSVFAQARNKRKKHNVQFDMELPKITLPEVDLQAQKFLTEYSGAPVALHQQRYLDEVKLRAFFPDKLSILLDEVVVKAEKTRPKVSTGPVKKDDGAYVLSWKEIAGTSDIIQYLAFKVPGVFPVDGGNSITLVSDQASMGWGVSAEPTIFIDGGAPLSVQEAKIFSVDIFETIEIITPPMSYSYRAISGAILLTTKSGRSLAERNAPLLGGSVNRVKGFSSHLEFYAPKYTPENIQEETPDIRSTLYWNPGIEIKSGQSKVSFFTSDSPAQYRILIEGITTNGKICLGEGKFEVQSQR